MRANLGRAIREAYAAPNEVFRLEVCFVTFEIRRATELAAELADAAERRLV